MKEINELLKKDHDFKEKFNNSFSEAVYKLDRLAPATKNKVTLIVNKLVRSVGLNEEDYHEQDFLVNILNENFQNYPFLKELFITVFNSLNKQQVDQKIEYDRYEKEEFKEFGEDYGDITDSNSQHHVVSDNLNLHKH